MNLRHALLGGLALAALGGGLPALAQDFPQEPPGLQQPAEQADGSEALASLGFEQVDRMVGILSLSPEQVGKLKKELVARTRERIRLTSQLQLQRFDLQILLDEPKPDAEAARKLQDQVQATESAVARNRLETILAVKSILTPEQQRKLSELGPRLGNRGPGQQRNPGARPNQGPNQGPGGRSQPGQGRPTP